MPSLNEAIMALDQYYNNIINLKDDLQKHMNSNLPKPQKDEIQALIEKQIDTWERYKRNTLEELINFPPHHVKHFAQLTAFQSEGAYDKSVFIMTKFPEMNNPQPIDLELQQVIQSVRDAITENGYTPRIAYDKRFHPGLWDNVEMYLLGCKRGVAIVENKYQNELNPNVTMEWGWMRGMDRNVLFLIENTFDKQRADINGLITDQFDWNNPNGNIRNAIKNWLQGN